MLDNLHTWNEEYHCSVLSCRVVGPVFGGELFDSGTDRERSPTNLAPELLPNVKEPIVRSEDLLLDNSCFLGLSDSHLAGLEIFG
jgi:hypothetical protein